MAYRALNEMKETLQAKFKGIEMGPSSPDEIKTGQKMDFKTAVKHFIHERCADLRFDANIANEEKLSGVYKGKSIREGQIPYNMQMDIDRLCLARAIERFLESGSKDDAFDVYFCFLEMFGGGYSSSRRMIELLSEYESTASTMLMSHRDHYSHSVYVFLLGVAIYDAIPTVREQYKKFYSIIDDKTAAHHFLQFWGVTALFHDIGYPFEIAFEQIKSYFIQRDEENGKTAHTKRMPFISYGNMNEYLKLDKHTRSKLKEWYQTDFRTIEEWLAYDIANLIKRSDCSRINNKTYKEVLGILKKEARSSINKKHMDHAYFSAIVLFKKLFEELGQEDSKNQLRREHLDTLTAIALHNSLYKRKISEDAELKLDDHAFMMDWHPLAYLLQLTDELQCWDRTAYGRNTRNELHSMSCNIEFDDESIYAEYVYDDAESKKVNDYWNKYKEYESNPETIKKPRLKKYSDMTNENAFAQEIGLIVGLSNYGSCKGSIKLMVAQKMGKADWGKKHVYLSSSSFIHIYEFAAALNAQYNKDYAPSKVMLDDFDNLSLEYKLSNIGKAKNFASVLNEIGCFYTDRPVAYEMVTDFTDEELMRLGEQEHKRWENEKQVMCWLPGGKLKYKLKENGNQLRELSRMHYDLGVKFNELSQEAQSKDYSHLNTLMEKLLEFDGIRVYRYQ
jgi:hypothetical protein